MTMDGQLSPRLQSLLLKAIPRVPVKYAYPVKFRARDEDVDLQGDDDTYTRIEDKIAQLDTWATGTTPLTMRVVNSPFDNKTVFVDPASLQPIAYVPDGVENHVAQMRLVEVG